mgnify:CR=1 FL=1
MTTAVLVASTLVASCGKADIGEGEPVETDSITADTTAMLTQREGSPTCKVHIGFKLLKGTNAQRLNDSLMHAGILVPDYLANIPASAKGRQQALAYFLARYVDDYRRDGRLILDQEPGYAGLNWEYSATTEVRRYREGIVAYIAHVHTFEGGLYPISQTVVRNIREHDGHILSLSDILIPGYDKTLLEEVTEQLAEDFQADGLEGLREKGLFIGIEPYLPENFIWGDGAIRFIYQSDEIAAHTMGEIAVTVRLKDKNIKQWN